MAISFKSLRTKRSIKPPICVIYGPGGRGKTFLAAGAPSPVVLAIEDGLGSLEVPHWPIASYSETMQALGVLASEPHDFRSVVIDSLDWLEPLIWAQVCRDNSWSSIEDPGYGKGYVHALRYWREVLDALLWLRNERGMIPVMIAHHLIKRFDDPSSEPYDRYLLKLQERAAGLVEEAGDVVGFLNYRMTIQKSKQGFDKQVTRATGGEQRLLHVEGRPAFVAKNRFNGMPPAIEIPKTNDPAVAWAKVASYFLEGVDSQARDQPPGMVEENQQQEERQEEQQEERKPPPKTSALKSSKTKAAA